MNTQNTPVHIKLWHREFWLMALASLVLTAAVYMLLPTMPRWLLESQNLTPLQTGLSMGAFGLGLYLLGSQCSWLVQHYRRNVVCMWAVVCVGLSAALLWYIDGQRTTFCDPWVILVQRLVMGAAFGLAQMVLSSTLIIDTCESYQRTEANHSASWFSRFALSLGPLAGLITLQQADFSAVLMGSMGCTAVVLVLIRMVKFPFRAPEEGIHVASLDRFLLPHGLWLFLNLLLVSTVCGLVLTLPLGIDFYALMMGGFLLALLAQRFVFRDAELKSEVITGLLLLMASLSVLLTAPDGGSPTAPDGGSPTAAGGASPVAPVLFGLGVGLTASRFLLFFIKLSRHCKRGTSQSTYFLGWETGLCLGLCLGYACFYDRPALLLCCALGVSAVALAMYHFFTHSWFMAHKNR